jgi:ornithine cyclodeaminase/alanine dehydrogenase-like protein (mu-crystallin family)
VTGTVAAPTDRPLVFKSVGMSWQDLVVATAVLERSGG